MVDVIDGVASSLRPAQHGCLQTRATLHPRFADALISIEDPPTGGPSTLQLAALEFITTWDRALFSRLAQATLAYCHGFSEEVGLTDFEGRTSAYILDCVRTSVIIIPSQVRATPVVRIELDCDWEPEHGLEWVVESPKFIRYVGPFRMIHDWLNDADPGYAYLLETSNQDS